MGWMIQVRGGEWAGVIGHTWRPACGGLLNQTGQSDASASTFDTREEAEQIRREMIDGGHPNPETEFRVVEVVPLREQAMALAKASGIVDGTGTLYTVCEQAIRDGEGTPDRVREIWAEATADWAAEREVSS